MSLPLKWTQIRDSHSYVATGSDGRRYEIAKPTRATGGKYQLDPTVDGMRLSRWQTLEEAQIAADGYEAMFATDERVRR